MQMVTNLEQVVEREMANKDQAKQDQAKQDQAKQDQAKQVQAKQVQAKQVLITLLLANRKEAKQVLWTVTKAAEMASPIVEVYFNQTLSKAQVRAQVQILEQTKLVARVQDKSEIHNPAQEQTKVQGVTA